MPTRRATPALIRTVACLALALGVSACASLVVTDTVALPPGRLAPPGAETISEGGYRLDALAPKPGTPDMIVLVAFSGGGKRSAAFSYGALKGLREVGVPTSTGPEPLLDELDSLTGVSGGSFTAAYYGLYRDAAFGRFEDDFLYRDTEASIFGVFLLPWNWTWLVDPTVGTNDFMERVYDRTMFHGATFADLQRLGRPGIGIGATDIATGSRFSFTQDNFDLICSDLSQFPLARAVAASNGFPGLFSPVTLTNHAAQCGGRRPGWLRRITPATRDDPRSRLGDTAARAEFYLDPERARYVHLIDGGVSDNLALRSSGTVMASMAASREGITAARLDHTRRVLVISVDGQGSQDSSVAQRRAVGGLFAVFGLVSGAQIDSFNFETIQVLDQQIADFVAALKKVRCETARKIDGAPCDDVAGALVHVSLSELPESPEKARLAAIPTGLTLRRDDVDALVAAGRSAIIGSAPLHDFIARYPVATSLAAR
jgi:NTE family protein